MSTFHHQDHEVDGVPDEEVLVLGHGMQQCVPPPPTAVASAILQLQPCVFASMLFQWVFPEGIHGHEPGPGAAAGSAGLGTSWDLLHNGSFHDSSRDLLLGEDSCGGQSLGGVRR